MSTNNLNDISKVYLTQIAEETPAERIDRISKANVAKQKKDSDDKKAASNKKTAEFQKHKASVMAKGGRPVDALDSWHKKQAHKESYSSVSEKKEVNVKDTYKTVAAIVDYDRSKKGSKDADYDSMKGDKKAAKKERDYAAFERGKMKKDDPNWKSKKYHTGMHGESYETTKTKEVMGALKKRDLKQDVKKKIAADIVKKKGDTSKSDDRYAYEEVVHEQGIEDILARLEKKRISKGGNPDESPLGKKTGRAMKAQQDKARKKAGVSEGYGKKKKKKHDCASKVKHEEYGIGNCIPEMHDLDESGKVSHYDVEFEEYIVEGVPVGELEILEGHMHEHVIREKMAAKDYDGDGKIESGKDEYFGSKDKAIKKAMGKKKGVKEDIADILARLEKKRISKGGDPEESPLPAMRKYHADKKKKVKKESLSDWRTDLSDLVEIVAGPEDRVEKEVKEKKVKNKVVINPKFTEAVEDMGGELLEMVEVEEDYETKKKGEVLSALKKRDLDKKTKNKIADDIVKKKGDTSKSDDRYAYEGKMYGYSGGGLVKKELKDLKKGAETLKGKNIAKADKVEEGRKPKNCGCGQTPCITYGKKNKFNEAMSSYDKARKAAARRAADRNAARRRGELGGRMERETYTSEGGTRMHHKGYKAREGE